MTVRRTKRDTDRIRNWMTFTDPGVTNEFVVCHESTLKNVYHDFMCLFLLSAQALGITNI